MKLKELLTDILAQSDLQVMVNSYDLVGDILILELPDKLERYEQRIGDRILQHFPRVKVVARKKSHHRGEYRTRNLTIIAGEQRMETIHRENGVTLHLNPWEVYYSVRSGGERFRIATQVRPEEHVGVLGSGIAPFPLVIARHSDAAHILGIEINPAAHRYATRNVQVNKYDSLIKLALGDAATVLSRQEKKYDRIISILPTDHQRLLLPALKALRKGSILHHYAMVHQENTLPIQALMEQACTRSGHEIKHISWHKCGHCGSQTDRCCFTVQV